MQLALNLHTSLLEVPISASPDGLVLYFASTHQIFRNAPLFVVR